MVHHILSRSEDDLLSLISAELSLSSNEIEFLLSFGAVYLNHNRALKNEKLKIQDYIRIHTQPRRFPSSSINWKNQIIFENEEFVVIDKPSGIPSHATVDNFKENAIWEVSSVLDRPVHITNRIDIATRGLLLLAKDKKFQTRFNGLIRDGKVEKKYLATVKGEFKTIGLLTHYMENSNYQPKKISATVIDGWLKCQLEILQTIYNQKNNTSQIEIRLLTGRTHQIRAQLSFLGFPIIGDYLYQNSNEYEKFKERIELESYFLKFQDKLIDYEFKL